MSKIIFELDMSVVTAKNLLLNHVCDNCFWNFSYKCTFNPNLGHDYARTKLLSKNNTCISWAERGL